MLIDGNIYIQLRLIGFCFYAASPLPDSSSSSVSYCSCVITPASSRLLSCASSRPPPTSGISGCSALSSSASPSGFSGSCWVSSCSPSGFSGAFSLRYLRYTYPHQSRHPPAVFWCQRGWAYPSAHSGHPASAACPSSFCSSSGSAASAVARCSCCSLFRPRHSPRRRPSSCKAGCRPQLSFSFSSLFPPYHRGSFFFFLAPVPWNAVRIAPED